MKRFLVDLEICAALMMACCAASGANYYVDANNGKDDDPAYDGTSPGKAKKTLAAAMAIGGLTSGNTVWAAEGDYNDGEMKQSTSAVLASRVVVPDGVRLEASGRRTYTFITGRAATGEGIEYSSNGLNLGNNGLRCVYLSGTARIRGFTIRNGHTCRNVDTSSVAHNAVDYQGGAVYGGSYVEDCTITDCHSYNLQVTAARYINCSFTALKCVLNYGTANVVQYAHCCNCYFDSLRGGRATMYMTLLLNCTFGTDIRTESSSGTVDPMWSTQAGHLVNNSLFGGGGTGNGGKQTDCLLSYATTPSHTLLGETHVEFVKLADMGLDSDYAPLSKNAASVDFCTNSTFATMYATYFPSATKAWNEVTDLKGNPRISNGTVDAGCYEFDWRPVFSKDLSSQRVTVTNASWNVTETAAKHVSLGTNAAFDVAWTSPNPSASVEYSFDAVVSGTGTLKVYADGDDSPFAVVTSADGLINVPRNKTGNIAFRFVYEGEDGSAEVWNCQDSVYANITVADGGIAIAGDITAPGDHVLTEPTTFTLTRTFDSSHLCTGFTTNNVFVSWDDLPGGTFTWTVSNKATSLNIVAVYMEHQTWYVDAVNGDDGNDGFLPTRAKWTLVGAMTNSLLTAGDTVLALPGSYDVGEMIVPGSSHTISNRVYVPEGVHLRSRDGAAVTKIVGAESPNPTQSGYKLGPGAVRCVYLASNSSIEGFTIKNGRTGYNGSTSGDDYTCGGIYAQTSSWVVDCMVTNCWGSWRGLFHNGSAVRTKFVNGGGANYNAGVSAGSYYNCYFGGLTGSYGIYTPVKLVNCTLGASSAGYRDVSVGTGPCYNCIIAGSIHQAGTFRRCIIAKEVFVNTSSQTYDPDCITNMTIAALNLDANDNYRPLPGSVAVDFGNNDYLSQIPEQYRTSAYDGGQRVYNGRVDAGCHEHDIRAELASDLSAGAVTVSVLSSGVRHENSAAVIPAGEEMTLGWKTSGLATTRFAFELALTGEGALKGYVNGSQEPAFTATESGLVTFDYAGAEPISLRLAAEGDGAVATVRAFSNIDAALIFAPDRGLVVEGAVLGTNVVAAGQTLTFTIRRAYDSTRLSTGFTVNGVAYSWADYPNGWTHTVDAADRSTTVLVGATYLATGEQGWYVDAVNGNDANRGLAPENAKRTLADVCTNAPVAAGETIWLLPGAYDEGVIQIGTDKTGNRGVIPAGVNLASTSGAPDDTFVVGASTPVEERTADNGECGLGCVRCLKVLGNNVISNLTFCGGRAWTDKFGSACVQREYYGAIAGGASTVYAVGCVLSNNVANIDSVAGYMTFVRCRICKNTAKWYSGLPDCSLYGCLVYDNEGAYPVHNPLRLVNCTLGPNGMANLRSVTGTPAVYNTLWFGSAGDPISPVSFYRTYFADANVATNLVALWADGCKTNAELTAVSLDATKTPVKGACEAMEAANADYLSLYPAQFAHEALVDFYGNPRILGGGLDLGAVEYDWRTDFAADLGGRLQVPMASSNVVETSARTVRLPDGQSLTVAPESAARVEVGRTFPVSVTDGTLTVAVNGTVVATFDASGEWVYRNGAADDLIVFSFVASAGGGFADLARTRSNRNLILFVR